MDQPAVIRCGFRGDADLRGELRDLLFCYEVVKRQGDSIYNIRALRQGIRKKFSRSLV